MKKDKGTNNHLQNITHKAKDTVTGTPLKNVGLTQVTQKKNRKTERQYKKMYIYQMTRDSQAKYNQTKYTSYPDDKGRGGSMS